MAVGNTIGRIVGQSPASTSPPNMANPIAQLFQGLQQLIPMWQQLQGLIQQLGGGGGGGGGAQPSAPSPAPSTSPSAAPASAAGAAGDSLRSPAELQASLTDLGQRLRARPETMEGPPRPDQRLTRALTDEILRQAMIASGPRGSAVHQLTLDTTEARVADLAAQAPSPAQAAQAVGNAATMANGRGAGAPVMQMLQKLMGMFQQALSLLQGLQKRTNGAQIKQ